MELYVSKNGKQLRCGVTTGTCCAAAAHAAAMYYLHLWTGETDTVAVHTPKGVRVDVPVYLKNQDANSATVYVIKDSGDDPDVTDGATIEACLKRITRQDAASDWFIDEERKGLYLTGGIGVGRVTKEGLPEEIGQAAINPVPREMIFRAVRDALVLGDEPETEAFLITVSVPDGESLAERTFNGRLGIEGGLSILGTSGILEPMSEKAIVDTIELEIRQRAASGCRNLLLAPGNYGRSYVQEYLHLNLNQAVKCSNYIGEAIDLATLYGFERILLVGNIGKLIKLAGGIMNTHSRVADARAELMALHALLNGATRQQAEELLLAVNTEEMLALLIQYGIKDAVMESISTAIDRRVNDRCGKKARMGVMLFSERYGFLTQTHGAEELLPYFISDGD